jgi:ABC-type tungstate transport system substrate-binding protein
MATGTVSRANRRRIVSPWFKRQMVTRISLVGLAVLAAACLAFGAVGIGIGVAVLIGGGALAYVRRRRRWRSPPPIFERSS